MCAHTRTHAHTRNKGPFSISLGMVKDGVLTIGAVSAPIYNPDDKIKVPDVLFYDNPQVITHATQNQMFYVRHFVSQIQIYKPYENVALIIV